MAPPDQLVEPEPQDGRGVIAGMHQDTATGRMVPTAWRRCEQGAWHPAHLDRPPGHVCNGTFWRYLNSAHGPVRILP